MPERISVFYPTWTSVVAVSWTFWPHSSETYSPEPAKALQFLCWSRERGGEKRQPKSEKVCWGVEYIPFGPTVWAVNCLCCIKLSHVIFPFHADLLHGNQVQKHGQSRAQAVICVRGLVLDLNTVKAGLCSEAGPVRYKVSTCSPRSCLFLLSI